jgi:hypothetical protein
MNGRCFLCEQPLSYAPEGSSAAPVCLNLLCGLFEMEGSES